MSTHCCDRMDYDVAQTCDMHPTRFDCPDALVAIVRDGYGLIVHDGGQSVIEIRFCPRCGSRIPEMHDIDEAETDAAESAS